MTEELLTFEHPMNEKVRTQLRLEFLYNKIQYAIQSGSQWDHRDALFVLLDIMAVLARGDVRAEISKELERIKATLLPLRAMSGVNQTQLHHTIDQIDYFLPAIIDERRQASDLKDVAFLAMIRQRAGLPGGACEFDLPALHAWLNQPAAYRQDDLQQWVESFQALNQSNALCLDLLRASATTEAMQCPNGNLHHSLAADRDCQLVRISIDKNLHCYPVISGNRHGVSMRFMRQLDLAQKDQPFTQALNIQLACSYL